MPDRKKWIIGFKACSEAHDSIHSRRHSVFGALIVYIRTKLDLFFRLPNSSTKLLVYLCFWEYIRSKRFVNLPHNLGIYKSINHYRMPHFCFSSTCCNLLRLYSNKYGQQVANVNVSTWQTLKFFYNYIKRGSWTIYSVF